MDGKEGCGDTNPNCKGDVCARECEDKQHVFRRCPLWDIFGELTFYNAANGWQEVLRGTMRSFDSIVECNKCELIG